MGKVDSRKRNEAADFCNEVVPYEIGSDWAKLSDLDDHLTSREYVEEPTTPAIPFSPSSKVDDNILRSFREIFPDHLAYDSQTYPITN